jgi:hypothetical protein
MCPSNWGKPKSRLLVKKTFESNYKTVKTRSKQDISIWFDIGHLNLGLTCSIPRPCDDTINEALPPQARKTQPASSNALRREIVINPKTTTQTTTPKSVTIDVREIFSNTNPPYIANALSEANVSKKF